MGDNYLFNFNLYCRFAGIKGIQSFHDRHFVTRLTWLTIFIVVAKFTSKWQNLFYICSKKNQNEPSSNISPRTKVVAYNPTHSMFTDYGSMTQMIYFQLHRQCFQIPPRWQQSCSNTVSQDTPPPTISLSKEYLDEKRTMSWIVTKVIQQPRELALCETCI